jgi:hypothetical protein
MVITNQSKKSFSANKYIHKIEFTTVNLNLIKTGALYTLCVYHTAGAWLSKYAYFDNNKKMGITYDLGVDPGFVTINGKFNPLDDNTKKILRLLNDKITTTDPIGTKFMSSIQSNIKTSDQKKMLIRETIPEPITILTD